jgi:hypothetical protein
MSKAAAEADPEKGIQILEDHIKNRDAALMNFEKENPENAGAMVAFYSHPALVQSTSNETAFIREKLNSLSATDPDTGTVYSGSQLRAILAPGSAATDQQKLSAANALLRSSATSGSMATTRENAKKWMDEAKSEGTRATNPELFAMAKVLEAKQFNPQAYKKYEESLAINQPAGEALNTLVKDVDDWKESIRSGGSPKITDGAAAVLPTSAQEANSGWAVRDAGLNKLQDDNKFGFVTAPKNLEERSVSVLAGGYKQAYERLAQAVANPGSKAEYDKSVADLDELTKNQTSEASKDIVLNKRTAIEGAVDDPREARRLDYKQRFSSGKDAGPVVVKDSLRDYADRGGNSWLPPGASSSSASIATLAKDLGPLAKEASAYKIDPRKAVNPETGRQFRSVAELVLWEREKSAGMEFRSNAQILAELMADRFITGGPMPKGVVVAEPGKNTVLAHKSGGRPTSTGAIPPPAQVIGASTRRSE